MNKYILAGSSIIALMLLVVVLGRPDYFDPLCRIIGFTDTVYASDFSRAKFTQVKMGMPRAEVKNLLGTGFMTFNVVPCLDPGTMDQERWFYSAGSDNHWRFWITFDENDKVSRIQREFFWD